MEGGCFLNKHADISPRRSIRICFITSQKTCNHNSTEILKIFVPKANFTTQTTWLVS